jgi:hypothetical protein
MSNFVKNVKKMSKMCSGVALGGRGDRFLTFFVIFGDFPNFDQSQDKCGLMDIRAIAYREYPVVCRQKTRPD